MPSDLQTQLQEELAEVDWTSLKPHASRDALIIVNPLLDLVKVGVAIAEDDKQSVAHWINEQLIVKPSAEDLGNWNGQPEKMFKTLIVQPFVLICAV
ncbi:MAG: DUF2288 domain-containing protein [Cyanobacteria bacterium SBLK]|nr:DUF2288 domain-containing protein [Cyanobacteria bacterium SBLK]